MVPNSCNKRCEVSSHLIQLQLLGLTLILQLPLSQPCPVLDCPNEAWHHISNPKATHLYSLEFRALFRVKHMRCPGCHLRRYSLSGAESCLNVTWVPHESHPNSGPVKIGFFFHWDKGLTLNFCLFSCDPDNLPSLFQSIFCKWLDHSYIRDELWYETWS